MRVPEADVGLRGLSFRPPRTLASFHGVVRWGPSASRAPDPQQRAGSHSTLKCRPDLGRWDYFPWIWASGPGPPGHVSGGLAPEQVWGGTGAGQWVSEDVPDRPRASPPPACRPTRVFWWVLQSHRVIWLGRSLSRLPAPRRQPVYKGAASPALLTGGLESGGTMDVISVRQLVRTWGEGQEGRQSSGHPQIVSAKRGEQTAASVI